MAGYHLSDIQKGTLGEISKIQEELDELKGAKQIDQNLLTFLEGIRLHTISGNHIGMMQLAAKLLSE